MSKTSATTHQLSSSLKERLKKCGRYHASPEPVAKQPKITVTKCIQEQTPDTSKLTQSSISPQRKKQCVVVSNLNKVESEDINGCHSNTSPVSVSRDTHHHQDTSLQVDKTGVPEVERGNSNDHCHMNQTPLTQRSRSSNKQVIKGSKLSFENADRDNSHRDQIKSENQTAKIKRDSSDVNDSGQTDLDLCVVSTRSSLLKELEVKEEHLRKLRMVKMYRSKNNLEELQTLIDKWRAVSQQALQDLHDDMPEPRPSLTELINHLGIDHQLLHFSEEDDETFF